MIGKRSEELKQKQDEISQLNKTLFGMSDEMKEMKKAKKDAVKAKGKIEIPLKRKHEDLMKTQ